MNEINFANSDIFIATTFITFLAIFFRYVILAFLIEVIFTYLLKSKFSAKKISIKPRSKIVLRKELIWSTLTSAIFAITGIFLLVLWQQGYTKVYVDIREYPWWNYPLSIFLFLLFHETYYYWLHRWMHNPSVFKIVHKAHHESITPSPWTAFSFHPLESLLQAVVLPLFLLVYPMHFTAIIFLLVLMTVSSFINHLNFEIYPNGFEKNRFGKWLIGATHHTLHHTRFTANFGLYFTFWDKWMNTESPEYESLLNKKSNSKSINNQEIVG